MQVIWFSSFNNLFSLKIRHDMLIGQEEAKMFEEVVQESYFRGLEYMVTNIHKKEVNNFAWIVATSPK